jgi:UDP-glucose 4-epimerase
MKILVTGGLGALGARICAALNAAGHEVRCFDLPTRTNRRTARRSDHGIAYVWGDIRNQESVNTAVADREVIVHTAAILPPRSETTPKLARQVNVQGTENLLRAAKAMASKPAFVYTSSVTVFGLAERDTRPRRPSDAVKATDCYTAHKIACEDRIRTAGLRWLVLRIGVSLDPNLDAGSPEALRTLFRVSLASRMEYVHPDDVARAITNAVHCSKIWGRTLLIGGGPTCQITLRDLMHVLFAALGAGSLPENAFGERAYYTDWMDTSLSQSLLNYQTWSFDDFRTEALARKRLFRALTLPLRPILRQALLYFARSRT